MLIHRLKMKANKECLGSKGMAFNDEKSTYTQHSEHAIRQPSEIELPRGSVTRRLRFILDYRHVDYLDVWPPSLETLVLGSFTYRDLRNGLGCYEIDDINVYKYRQPHIYRIDREYRHEGRRKPLAILHETGTYEKTEAAGGIVEVLKPYWLA